MDTPATMATLPRREGRQPYMMKNRRHPPKHLIEAPLVETAATHTNTSHVHSRVDPERTGSKELWTPFPAVKEKGTRRHSPIRNDLGIDHRGLVRIAALVNHEVKSLFTNGRTLRIKHIVHPRA